MTSKILTAVFSLLIYGAAMTFPGASLAGSKAIYENPVEPQGDPKINLGRMNFEAYCASCHGKTGRGTDKGPTFISPVYHPGHHADGSFYLAAKRGARAHHWKFGDMAPIPGITDAQITSIIEYVRAVQKANGLF